MAFPQYFVQKGCSINAHKCMAVNIKRSHEYKKEEQVSRGGNFFSETAFEGMEQRVPLEFGVINWSSKGHIPLSTHFLGWHAVVKF